MKVWPICAVWLAAVCTAGCESGIDFLPSESDPRFDQDGDGFCASVVGCVDGSSPADCDDGDPAVHPGAPELCNAADENCDGVADDGFDSDTDGSTVCGDDGVTGTEDDDCDDGDPAVYPDAPELCNAVDDNCDGVYDEGFDADSDGMTICGADGVSGTEDDDCNDGDPAVHPEAPELCNAVDDNCDGVSDEGFDADADGTTVCGEDGVPDTDDDDCDDGDSAVNPDAPELCNAYDDNCDGVVDEGFDADSDGTTVCGGDGVAGTEDDDCDDTEPTVHPGLAEVCNDGLDNDCDGTNNGCLLEGDLSVASAIKFVGEAEDDHSGRHPSVGDVDGDGIDDLLVGASGPWGGGRSGTAYLLYGPIGADLPLSSAVAVFSGEAAGDEAGVITAYLGDADGDGFGDVAISAYRNDSGGADAGATYVFYGPAHGEVSLSSADAKFIGEAASDLSGVGMAAAGDLDGDGRADLLIGAFKNDAGGTDAGAVYVAYGPYWGEIDLVDADAKIIGEEEGDQAGLCVVPAGDVDADGYTDILVGARFHSHTATNAGAAYLVAGPVVDELDLIQATAKLVGEHEGDSAGFALSSAGDVNGDGHDDILIGAYLEDSGGDGAGAAYLVHGPVVGLVDLGTADAKIEGEAAGDQAGRVMTPVGDIDQDGLGDLLVSARSSDITATNAGSVHLFYGPLSGTNSMADADAVFLGETEEDYLGSSLGTTGDLNDDGYTDLILGALYEDGGGSNAGATYLVLGLGL
jgi:hypothetical protein